MNEYCKGIIEALSWALSRTEVAAVHSKKPIVTLQREIEQLRDDILTHTAQDFIQRLRSG
ncbi:hypothetical protein MUP79_03110 [Candidatus Bathyarchaeota archaeon]|nr:hypothetical protein [Candidatus Bathyarchaeota archaeon]